MSDNPFTPIPGAAAESGAGEPSVSAGQIAAEAAAAAVRGVDTTPAVTDSLASQEAQYVQPVEDQPQETAQLPNPQNIPTQVEHTQPFAADAYNQLTQLGIDLPVSPEAVSPEFADAYNLMAQKILDSHQTSQDRMMAAQVAQDRIEALSERLGTPEGQERLILSLALSNPENFANTMETVQRVQTDPDYAEAQRMRLEAEARYEQASRMENAIQTTQMQTKGQQVEGRTERMAQQLGVNVGIAKQMVASRILQNEATTGARDITFAEVDQVMQQLAKATNPTGPVMTPAQKQAASQAPQAPASGVGQTPVPATNYHQQPAPTPVGSQSTPNSDAMDVLRGAVKAAAVNVRNKGL